MTIIEDLFRKASVHFEAQSSPPEQAETRAFKPRFKILSARDALQPQPPIQWVVDQLISAGSINMSYGEGSTKKNMGYAGHGGQCGAG